MMRRWIPIWFMTLTASVSGSFTLRQQMQLLKLPAARRKRMLGQIGRKVRVYSRKRLRGQRGLDGQPWEKRKEQKHKKNNQKMFRKFSKGLAVYSSADKVDITFSNYVTGLIAKKHHEGIDELMPAARAEKQKGVPDYDAPATRRQAKRLREAGYRVRRAKGKGWKVPSIKHIVETMTLGQAGMVLRMMRGADSKASWVIPTEKRDFLGATQKEIDYLAQHYFDETINSMKRAKR